MSDEGKSEDALFEALTIDKQVRLPARPHYYYNGKLWEAWWHSGQTPLDIVYYKPGGTYRKEVLHRIYGPAYISKKFDIEAWYKEGEFHRIGGPAYRHKNSKFWYQDGKLHRLDGPAVDASGHPKEYWIGGQQWSPKLYKKEIERRKRKGLL